MGDGRTDTNARIDSRRTLREDLLGISQTDATESYSEEKKFAQHVSSLIKR